MDETSRKRPLEEIDPSSTVSVSKRSRASAVSGRAQRQTSSSESSSSAETTSTASSRDSSDDETSGAEDDSDNESTSSAGTTASSTSSSSSSSSSSPSSERENGEGRESEDRENDVDESDGSSDDEASITNVPARPKPQIRRVNGDSSILSRISDFLPRLKAANEDLQRNIQAGKTKDVVMDDVNEESEGQYIEMNLGLGVLEEENTEGSDELSTEDGGDDPSDDEPGPSTTSPPTRRNTDILDKLMGKKTKPKRPAIEEMED